MSDISQGANMNLKPKQLAFVEALKDAGITSPVSRKELVAVANSQGSNYAPAWIVKDTSRSAGRGLFYIPEINGESSPVVAEVTPKVSNSSAPAPAPQVQTAPAQSNVTLSSDATLALGLTGGEHESLVPARMSTYVPFGHFRDIESIVRSRQFYPCFVTGLSGNGKTLMVDLVCAKLKRELFRVNITIETDEDDLLGGFRLIDGNTVWCNGPVVEAMLRGGILLLDEVDLASHKIMCLQPVLEGKGVFLKKIGKWITPAAGFQVFATANTKGKGSDDGRFVGTNVLNDAFLERFPSTFEQEYPSRAQEKKIITKLMTSLNTLDEEFADNLVKWAEIIRKTFYEGAIDEIITTRRLVNICQAFAIFNDRVKAITMCTSRFDDDTKEAFLNLYTKVDGDVGAAVAEEEAQADAEALENAARINLSTRFEQKDEVKNAGAKWDAPTKTWYIDAETYKSNREFWNQFSPKAEAPF